MRGVWRGIVDFVVGDDIWVAVAVLVLLGVAARLVQLGADAWWLLAAASRSHSGSRSAGPSHGDGGRR